MNYDIEHVVVLMLENRSFDHLFGYLDHPEIYEGLTDTESNPKSKKYKKFVSVKMRRNAHVTNDPPHDFKAAKKQMNLMKPGFDDPKNDGFYKIYSDKIELLKRQVEDGYLRQDFKLADPAEVMECYSYNSREIRIMRQLAKRYVLCDHWFSSMPGPTHPNRHFVHAGQSYGLTKNKLSNVKDDRTIYKILSKHKRSWNIYCDGLNPSMMYTDVLKNVKYGGFKSFNKKFKEDVDCSRLANYVFIEPRHMFGNTNNMHPGENAENTKNMLRGEDLVGSIYNTLISNPRIWDKTLFIITFDEHGGFFDHVPPPTCTPPFKNGKKKGFQFDRYGFRVPTILMSPHLKPGTIDSNVYDHTSIIKTVFKIFSIQENLTDRDKNAACCLANYEKRKAGTANPRKVRLHNEESDSKRELKKIETNDLQKELIALGKKVRRNLIKESKKDENQLSTNRRNVKVMASEMKENVDGDILTDLFLKYNRGVS